MSTPVVLITGALTGIGRATAIAFAKEGARLVVAGRHEDAGQQLTTELRELGAEAEFIRADVRQEDEVRDLVDQTSMSRSTMLAPKAKLVRSRTRPQKAMPRRSTPMCWA